MNIVRYLPPEPIRNLVAGLVIVVAIQSLNSADLLLDATKPLVVAILRLCGVSAIDAGGSMKVGEIVVPWTRDCDGVNLLLILLALTVIQNFRCAWDRKLAGRVALMLPAALLANVLRVLSIIAYRVMFHPLTESPQLHYFMGLGWLALTAVLTVPRERRPLSTVLFENMHGAAVLALVVPAASAPNGILITVASLVLLSGSALRSDGSTWRLAATVVWLLVGFGIGAARVESLWLPWLLLCPLLINIDVFVRLPGWLLLACTNSVFVMQPWAWLVGGLGLVLMIRKFYRPTPINGCSMSPPVLLNARPRSPLLNSVGAIFGLCCCCLPFVAPGLTSAPSKLPSFPPPVRVRPLEANAVELQLPGQSPEIGIVCYSATAGDRHHTLSVCLKYRGVELSSEPKTKSVFSDGQNWLREFFLQGSVLHRSYADYVHATFLGPSDPGLHVIFVARQRRIGAQNFTLQCDDLAQRLHSILTSVHPSARPVATSSSP